jgi:hypothetical protein
MNRWKPVVVKSNPPTHTPPRNKFERAPRGYIQQDWPARVGTTPVRVEVQILTVHGMTLHVMLTLPMASP